MTVAATTPQRVSLTRADGSPIAALVVDDEAVLAEMVSMALRYEGWSVTTAGDGAAALEYAREHRWEGVVAKKWNSTYQPGVRSSAWIKDKVWHTQEIVIGGWRQGEGGRSSGIGALLMGIPGPSGLDFVGRVGKSLCVVDWKTAEKPKREDWIDDYFAQVAAYVDAVEFVYGVEIDDAAIVIALPSRDAQVFWLGDDLAQHQEQFQTRLSSYRNRAS